MPAPIHTIAEVLDRSAVYAVRRLKRVFGRRETHGFESAGWGKPHSRQFTGQPTRPGWSRQVFIPGVEHQRLWPGRRQGRSHSACVVSERFAVLFGLLEDGHLKFLGPKCLAHRLGEAGQGRSIDSPEVVAPLFHQQHKEQSRQL